MRVKAALGLSTIAIMTSMGAVGYSAVNNSNRVDDFQRVNEQQARLIHANEIATSQAQKTSHAACLRSRKLAPPLLAHYASFKGTPHEIPAWALKAFNETVPKSCPN
jgi:hypothetical protein